MKLPKSLGAKRDEQARILIGKYPEYPVTDPYDFKTGYNAAIKDLINSDALVSIMKFKGPGPMIRAPGALPKG